MSISRTDAITEREIYLANELHELDVAKTRLTQQPASFGELLDWLDHYRRYGNHAQ